MGCEILKLVTSGLRCKSKTDR